MFAAIAFLFMAFLAVGIVTSAFFDRDPDPLLPRSLCFAFFGACLVFCAWYAIHPMLSSDGANAATSLQRVVSSLQVAGTSFVAFLIARAVVGWWASFTGIDQGEQ